LDLIARDGRAVRAITPTYLPAAPLDPRITTRISSARAAFLTATPARTTVAMTGLSTGQQTSPQTRRTVLISFARQPWITFIGWPRRSRFFCRSSRVCLFACIVSQGNRGSQLVCRPWKPSQHVALRTGTSPSRTSTARTPATRRSLICTPCHAHPSDCPAWPCHCCLCHPSYVLPDVLAREHCLYLIPHSPTRWGMPSGTMTRPNLRQESRPCLGTSAS